MIDFHFVGNSTPQRREEAKERFIKSLGTFKDEFNEKNGQVTVNFNEPPESTNFFQFGFLSATVDELVDFIRRHQLAYPAKGI